MNIISYELFILVLKQKLTKQNLKFLSFSSNEFKNKLIFSYLDSVFTPSSDQLKFFQI